MFCPKCGSADQSIETFCRNCGTFLPDFERIKKKEISVEEHIKVNTFFTVATAVVSASLAIALYVTLINRSLTPPWIIYPVFGFLIAMTAWQIQTFVRTRMLKRQFEKLRPKRDIETREAALDSKGATNLLDEANFEDAIPVSVTEMTTRNLSKLPKNYSAKPQQ